MNNSLDANEPNVTMFKETAMQTETTSALIEKLRLPSNYGNQAGTKKILTTVPIGKPGKDKFFRTHPDDNQTMEALVYEEKEQGETYIINPQIAPLLGSLVRRVRLYIVVDRANNPSLIPVPLVGEDGVRNRWHESLEKAVLHGQKSWIRIMANKATGSYDIYEAVTQIAPPTWPSGNPPLG